MTRKLQCLDRGGNSLGHQCVWSDSSSGQVKIQGTYGITCYAGRRLHAKVITSRLLLQLSVRLVNNVAQSERSHMPFAHFLTVLTDKNLIWEGVLIWIGLACCQNAAFHAVCYNTNLCLCCVSGEQAGRQTVRGPQPSANPPHSETFTIFHPTWSSMTSSKLHMPTTR